MACAMCRARQGVDGTGAGGGGGPAVPDGRSRVASVGLSSAASTPAKCLPADVAALLDGMEMEEDDAQDLSADDACVTVSDGLGGTLAATVRDGAVCIDFGGASDWLLSGLAAAGAEQSTAVGPRSQTCGDDDVVAGLLHEGDQVPGVPGGRGLVQKLQHALGALEEQQNAARLCAIAGFGEVYQREVRARCDQLRRAAQEMGPVADDGSEDDSEDDGAFAGAASTYSAAEWVDMEEAERRTRAVLAAAAMKDVQSDSSDD